VWECCVLKFSTRVKGVLKRIKINAILTWVLDTIATGSQDPS
jgi:hypothetical protein